jgi:hypothetical protein
MSSKPLISLLLSTFILCIAVLACGVEPGLASPSVITAGDLVVPYDNAGEGDVSAAAARICNIQCTPASGGCVYTFEIEVFELSWSPVYSVEFEEINGAAMDPLGWPTGWMVNRLTDSLHGPDRIVFKTFTNPITPGTTLGGFTVMSPVSKTVFRWYPADEAGCLMGKITRQELSCPTKSQPQRWGALKALYR